MLAFWCFCMLSVFLKFLGILWFKKFSHRTLRRKFTKWEFLFKYHSSTNTKNIIQKPQNANITAKKHYFLVKKANISRFLLIKSLYRLTQKYQTLHKPLYELVKVCISLQKTFKKPKFGNQLDFLNVIYLQLKLIKIYKNIVVQQSQILLFNSEEFNKYG